MKTQIALFAYAIGSAVLGLLVCSFMVWGLRSRVGAIGAALLFFGGPVVAYMYDGYAARRDLREFQEDVAYVKELCAKYGGDKIYKTVDDVEGVFQMKARNPDQDKQWADQFGMVEPWAQAFGDRDSGAVRLGTRRGQGYWFIEQQPGFGMPAGPPYRRTLLILTPNKAAPDDFQAIVSVDGLRLKQHEISVPTLKSRYGYATEDLSTPELRKRWIGGGKLKIIDLRTNEVLAERTDFYRATGPGVQMAWAAGTACRVDEMTYLAGFIRSVLRPPRSLPTEQQLSQLKEE